MMSLPRGHLGEGERKEKKKIDEGGEGKIIKHSKIYTYTYILTHYNCMSRLFSLGTIHMISDQIPQRQPQMNIATVFK